MTELIRPCPDCALDRPFQPGHAGPGCCPDAPGGECPEIWCPACGAALLTGPLPVPAAVAPRLARRAA